MLERIIKIVKEAGQIMLTAQQVKDGVENKQGRANFVTEYDVKVQEFLFRELSVLLPEAVFIGEEEEGNKTINDGYCFIIDPIDGTTNFICDYKHSCISVGLMYRHKMSAGVVYDPYLDETFHAKTGEGAFLNGSRLQLKDLPLSDGIVAIGTSPYYREKADETFRIARTLYDNALDIRRSGAAALDICYVAAGRTVLFYEMQLSPWDFAAASVILAEAGGCCSTMEYASLTYHKPCSMIAATPSALKEYFQLFGTD